MSTHNLPLSASSLPTYGKKRDSHALALSASFLFAVWPLALPALVVRSLAVNIKLIIGPVSPACQVRRKTHIS